jgi:predicted heme/steroid binding protein
MIFVCLSLALASQASQCPGLAADWLLDDEPGWPVFTSEELEAHGPTSETILIAILGHVFDVTQAGEEFYGDTKAYAPLTGRDASRAFAVFSTKKRHIRPDVMDLEDKNLVQATERLRQYVDKYPCVGVTEGPYFNETGYPTETLQALKQRVLASPSRGEETADPEASVDEFAGPKCPMTKAAKKIRDTAFYIGSQVSEFMGTLLLAASPANASPEL